MAKQRHTMTSVRWTFLTLGTLALVVAFLVTDDVTARFTAGMAYGFGLVVLGVSERIIVSTRDRTETLLANDRQGIGGPG